MRLHLSLVALALLAGPAIAAPDVAATYLLSIHYDDGGALIGNPRLRVRAGEPSTIAVRDAAGNSFSARVTVVPQADGLVSIRSVLDTAAASGDRRHGEPALLITTGETASISIGELSASAQPVRVSFQLRPM